MDELQETPLSSLSYLKFFSHLAGQLHSFLADKPQFPQIGKFFLESLNKVFLFSQAGLIVYRAEDLKYECQAGFKFEEDRDLIEFISQNNLFDFLSSSKLLSLEELPVLLRKRLEEKGIELISSFVLGNLFKVLVLIGKKDTHQPYSQEEKLFIFVFLKYLEVFLENVHFRDIFYSQAKFKQRLKELKALQEISTAISLELDIEQLLRLVLEVISELLNTETGFVGITGLGVYSGQEIFFTSQGLNASQKAEFKRQFLERKGLVNRILENREVFLISKEDLACLEVQIEGWKPEFILGMPLRIRDEVVGGLAVARLKPVSFLPEDIHIFSTLGNQLITAILNARLYELSITDGLTGLYTHRYFEQRLREEICRARRYSAKVSLIMLDLDNFKECNDIFGHQIGNKVLKRASRILKSCVRANEDIPARWGGDEFAIILPHTPKKGARRLAERIRKAIQNYNFPELKRKLRVTLSLGVASFPEDAYSEKSLIEQADTLLYRAKGKGGNCVEVFSLS